MDQKEAAEISITESASLREALSRMLGLGFRHLPVVDDGGRLVGELSLPDVEAATRDGEE
jgi:CBS domain-containing protein